MLSLARWSSEHRRVVVVLWIVVLIAAMGISNAVGSHYGNNFSLPSTGGSLAAPAVRAGVEQMLNRMAHLPHVTSVTSPYAAGSRAISRDGRIGFATVAFDERANV